jgi:hypothetical protein
MIANYRTKYNRMEKTIMKRIWNNDPNVIQICVSKAGSHLASKLKIPFVNLI